MIIKQYNQLTKIKPSDNGKPYFDIRDILELNKYQTYVVISERGIGKSYSAMKFALEFAKDTGSYLYWLRISEKQLAPFIKSCLSDWDKEGYYYDKKILYSEKGGQILMKFTTANTIYNLKSTVNNACAGFIYDEFIAEGYNTGRNRDTFENLVNFIATIERSRRVFSIFLSNATHLNDPILENFGYFGEDIFVNEAARLKIIKTNGEYYINVDKNSNAYQLSMLNPKLHDQMYKAQFQTYTDDLIPVDKLPEGISVTPQYNFFIENTMITFSVLTNKNNVKSFYFSSNLVESHNLDLPEYAYDMKTANKFQMTNTLDVEKFSLQLTGKLREQNVYYSSMRIRDILNRITMSSVFNAAWKERIK